MRVLMRSIRGLVTLLVLGLVLLVACGPSQEDLDAVATQESLEAVATQESLEAVATQATAEAMAQATTEGWLQVCGGSAIEQAAAYTGGPGPHPIVLVNAALHEQIWTDRLPTDWVPESVSAAELVGCLEEEHNQIQICEYNGPPIGRYQYTLTIRLVAAQTGRTIATKTFLGDPPRGCKGTESYNTVVLYGSHITFLEVRPWLIRFVKPW